MNFKILIAFITMSLLQNQDATAQKQLVTDGHFITVDDISLHYRTGGSGPVLLLLHGFTLSSEQWAPFFDEFAQHYTVIAMDMPGHGRSDLLGEPFGFEKWADLMLNMLDQLEIESAYAAGHSAGAITLMHMAAREPKLFERLIVVSGGHRYTEEARDDIRHDSFEKAPDGLQQYYMDIHFGDTAKIQAMFDDINIMADQIPVHPDELVLNKQVLSEMTLPVLLVWGDRDFYFPVDIAVDLYHSLPNARLWVVPGQGHTPVWSFMGGDAEAELLFKKEVLNLLNE